MIECIGSDKGCILSLKFKCQQDILKHAVCKLFYNRELVDTCISYAADSLEGQIYGVYKVDQHLSISAFFGQNTFSDQKRCTFWK